MRWQTIYDNLEPRSLEEQEREKIRTLRWDLFVEEGQYYTLDELEEMALERSEMAQISNN